MNIKKYQELAPNTLNKDLTYTMILWVKINILRIIWLYCELRRYKMEVRCINKNIADLTFGKVYSVIDKTIDFYAIIDDSGYEWLYHKCDFEIVEE